MAHVDQIPDAAGITEPCQRTAAAILRAARNGLFTAAEAEALIDRVRSYTAISRTTVTGRDGDDRHGFLRAR